MRKLSSVCLKQGAGAFVGASLHGGRAEESKPAAGLLREVTVTRGLPQLHHIKQLRNMHFTPPARRAVIHYVSKTSFITGFQRSAEHCRNGLVQHDSLFPLGSPVAYQWSRTGFRHTFGLTKSFNSDFSKAFRPFSPETNASASLSFHDVPEIISSSSS